MNKRLLALFLVCLSISTLTMFEVVQQVLAPQAPSRNAVITPGTGAPCDIRIYQDSGQYGAANCRTGDNFRFNSTPDISALLNTEMTTDCPALSCDIYMEAGLYLATARITFSLSNMRLVAAAGASVEIKRTTGNDVLFITSNGVSGLYIEGIKFHQVFSPGGAFVSTILGTSNDNIIFQRDIFEAEHGQQIVNTWNGALGSLATNNVNTNIRYEDCVFDGTNLDGTGSPNGVTGIGRDVQFVRDSFPNYPTSAFPILLYGEGRQYLDGPFLVQNSIFKSGAHPLTLNQVWGALIVGNTFEVSSDGIRLEENIDFPGSLGPNRKVIISGNYIDVNEAGIPANAGIGFPTPVGSNKWQANDTVISNNVITATGVPSSGNAEGIAIYGGLGNATITGNILNGWKIDISIQYATLRGLVIQNNFLGGTSSSNSIKAGVAPSANIWITNNVDRTSNSLSLLGNAFTGFVFHFNDGIRTENSGNVTITASTTVTFNHLLITGTYGGVPSTLLLTPQGTGWGTYKATCTSTQCTITVINSGTYSFYWYALFWPNG